MDLNTKIIEAVRQQPDLYGNNSTLEERCIAWNKLAIKLNMREQYLKIRWHSLVQRYQNDPTFKYASKMDFLQRNTETPAQGGDWPEFIITEEDIKDREDDAEEYVFMELDEVENKAKPTKIEKPRPEKEIPKPQTEIQIKNVKTLMAPTVRQDKVKAPSSMTIHSVETLNRNSLTSNKLKDGKEISNIKTIQIASAKSAIQIETKKSEKPSEPIPVELKVNNPNRPKIFVISKDELKREEPKKEDLKEEEPTTEEPRREELKKDEPKKEDRKKEEPKKENSPPTNRCEDDIFGELVSAMLKRMDETKKKNVKKEIMNVLLT